MKSFRTLSGLMSSAALLLPFPLAAESSAQAGTANVALSATAHVTFRIVIPKVLYLGVASAVADGAGARSVAVFSNSHNVALTATARTSGAARASSILSSAARKVIAQDTGCVPKPAGSNRVVCTISMP